MKVGNKICPFRTYTLTQGACESECQLFFAGKTLEEGTCALAALPSIKHSLVSLDQTLADAAKTIAAK